MCPANPPVFRQNREAPGVNYKFEAVTIDENQQAAAHVDKNNKGHSYIILLGNYTGGALVFGDKKYP